MWFYLYFTFGSFTFRVFLASWFDWYLKCKGIYTMVIKHAEQYFSILFSVQLQGSWKHTMEWGWTKEQQSWQDLRLPSLFNFFVTFYFRVINLLLPPQNTEVKLTLEQHGFGLLGSTYMWVFCFGGRFLVVVFFLL